MKACCAQRPALRVYARVTFRARVSCSCEAYQTLLSFDAVLMCVELFTFMWTSLHFGVLAIIMGQVSARFQGSL